MTNRCDGLHIFTKFYGMLDFIFEAEQKILAIVGFQRKALEDVVIRSLRNQE